MTRTGIAHENLEQLGGNKYPGRGIVLGLNESGKAAIQAYWVMGRSEGSRARRLIQEGDIVRTEPHNLPPEADTSLTMYNAMRRAVGDTYVVSNGGQTDVIANHLEVGYVQGNRVEQSFKSALMTQSFEPDGPNFTARISGFTTIDPVCGLAISQLASIRRHPDTGKPFRAIFSSKTTSDGTMLRGLGQVVHTYTGDGDPLPAFTDPPFAIPLGEHPQEIAETLHQHLHPDNFVALAVRAIPLAGGLPQTHIINRHSS